MASLPPINFNRLAPDAQDILRLVTTDKEHVELISEFLRKMSSSAVVTIARMSSMKSEILPLFEKFVETRCNSEARDPFEALFTKFSSRLLSDFIDACYAESGKGSLCDSPERTETPQLKRRVSSSSSLSTSPPIKKGASSPPSKKLNPKVLLLLSPHCPEFWQYLIALTSLTVSHAPELVCAGCGRLYSVSNPHNFYMHVSTSHKGAFVAEPSGSMAAPPPFPPALEPDLMNLTESALEHVPPPWLAAMPITRLPASIQDRVHLEAQTLPATLLQPQHCDIGDDTSQWAASLAEV